MYIYIYIYIFIYVCIYIYSGTQISVVTWRTVHEHIVGYMFSYILCSDIYLGLYLGVHLI